MGSNESYIVPKFSGPDAIQRVSNAVEKLGDQGYRCAGGIAVWTEPSPDKAGAVIVNACQAMVKPNLLRR